MALHLFLVPTRTEYGPKYRPNTTWTHPSTKCTLQSLSPFSQLPTLGNIDWLDNNRAQDRQSKQRILLLKIFIKPISCTHYKHIRIVFQHAFKFRHVCNTCSEFVNQIENLLKYNCIHLHCSLYKEIQRLNSKCMVADGCVPFYERTRLRTVLFVMTTWLERVSAGNTIVSWSRIPKNSKRG